MRVGIEEGGRDRVRRKNGKEGGGRRERVEGGGGYGE